MACLIVVVAGLRAASSILVPFLVGLFIAILSMPIVFFLKSRGVRNWLAVVVAILADIGILVGASLLVGTSVNDLADSIPSYQARLNTLLDNARLPASWELWLTDHDIEVPDWRSWISPLINPEGVVDLLQRSLRGAAAVLSNTFIVALIAIFILFEGSTFPEKFRLAFGQREISGRFNRMTEEVQRYLVLKTGISLVTGALIGIWATILGVDFAMLWALVAFLFNFIPNLGSILAALPACTLALIQLGLGRSLLLAAGYLAVNVVLGNFIEPTVMGRRLGMSTLVVFLSLVFWGWVWGPVGMFLSVPLTMIVKIMLENSEDLRPIAVLLGPSPHVERPERPARARPVASAPPSKAALDAPQPTDE